VGTVDVEVGSDKTGCKLPSSPPVDGELYSTSVLSVLTSPSLWRLLGVDWLERIDVASVVSLARVCSPLPLLALTKAAGALIHRLTLILLTAVEDPVTLPVSPAIAFDFLPFLFFLLPGRSSSESRFSSSPKTFRRFLPPDLIILSSFIRLSAASSASSWFSCSSRLSSSSVCRLLRKAAAPIMSTMKMARKQDTMMMATDAVGSSQKGTSATVQRVIRNLC